MVGREKLESDFEEGAKLNTDKCKNYYDNSCGTSLG